MKYLLLLFSVLTTSAALAQFDTSGRSIAIPSGEKKSESGISTPPETPKKSRFDFDIDSPPSKSFQIGKEKKPFDMTIKNDFANPGDQFADRVKIKPRGESNEAYRGNQHFGEYRSNSKFVKIVYRDFAYFDGDKIKVLVNDKVVAHEVLLTNDFKEITIELKDGFNKIEFEALNQGTSGPNTAEFRIFDDKENSISANQWNLATGFKASVLIVKE